MSFFQGFSFIISYAQKSARNPPNFFSHNEKNSLPSHSSAAFITNISLSH